MAAGVGASWCCSTDATCCGCPCWGTAVATGCGCSCWGAAVATGWAAGAGVRGLVDPPTGRERPSPRGTKSSSSKPSRSALGWQRLQPQEVADLPGVPPRLPLPCLASLFAFERTQASFVQWPWPVPVQALRSHAHPHSPHGLGMTTFARWCFGGRSPPAERPRPRKALPFPGRKPYLSSPQVDQSQFSGSAHQGSYSWARGLAHGLGKACLPFPLPLVAASAWLACCCSMYVSLQPVRRGYGRRLHHRRLHGSVARAGRLLPDCGTPRVRCRAEASLQRLTVAPLLVPCRKRAAMAALLPHPGAEGPIAIIRCCSSLRLLLLLTLPPGSLGRAGLLPGREPGGIALAEVARRARSEGAGGGRHSEGGRCARWKCIQISLATCRSSGHRGECRLLLRHGRWLLLLLLRSARCGCCELLLHHRSRLLLLPTWLWRPVGVHTVGPEVCFVVRGSQRSRCV